MFESYFPQMFKDRIQDIELETLAEKRIKGLILDIDNTLVPSHVKDADENAVRWIERVRNAGLKACIVSNASKKRVVRFNERLQVLAIPRASKPGSKAFLKAADMMGIQPGEIAVIGDQIFTDIRGGNKLGMYTILVKPIHRREFFLIKFKRLAEVFIMFMYRRKMNAAKSK